MFIGTRDDLPRLRAVQGLRFDAMLRCRRFGRSRSVSPDDRLLRRRPQRLGRRRRRLRRVRGRASEGVADRRAVGCDRPGEPRRDLRRGVHPAAPAAPQRRAYAAGVRRSEPLPYSDGLARRPARWRTGCSPQLYERRGLNLDEERARGAARRARTQRSVELFADAADRRPRSERQDGVAAIAVASTSAVSSTCHGRAPSSRSTSATSSTLAGDGGCHSTRRT